MESDGQKRIFRRMVGKEKYIIVESNGATKKKWAIVLDTSSAIITYRPLVSIRWTLSGGVGVQVPHVIYL